MSSTSSTSDGTDTPVTVDVPDIIGLSPKEAEAALADVGLTLHDQAFSSGGYGHAMVVTQMPPPGTTVTVGSAVVVSSGPA